MPPKDQSIGLSLLSRAHSPDTASQIHTEKVLQRPLHLKPTTVPSVQTAQQTRRAVRDSKRAAKKIKPKPLTSRQKRALRIYEIPKAAQKYAIYTGLHSLWQGYMQELLGLNVPTRRGPIANGEVAKLCAADFHGAEMEVVRSRCVE